MATDRFFLAFLALGGCPWIPVSEHFGEEQGEVRSPPQHPKDTAGSETPEPTEPEPTTPGPEPQTTPDTTPDTTPADSGTGGSGTTSTSTTGCGADLEREVSVFPSNYADTICPGFENRYTIAFDAGSVSWQLDAADCNGLRVEVRDEAGAPHVSLGACADIIIGIGGPGWVFALTTDAPLPVDYTLEIGSP